MKICPRLTNNMMAGPKNIISFCDILIPFYFSLFLYLLLLPVVSCNPLHILSSKLNTTRMLNLPPELTKLHYNDIKPPDHLQGVKMERDGHLNKEFHKEVLLGNVNGTEDEKLLISVHKRLERFMCIRFIKFIG